MAIEIERKFLVDLKRFSPNNSGVTIKQGYIPTKDNTAVRVRISADQAVLTIKGENNGISRLEFEYPIPLPDASMMLENLCKGSLIDKTRYIIEYQGYTWEVDVFHGDNQGLVVAEVELENETDTPSVPPWITIEVSGQVRYYNSNLMHHPYKNWEDEDI